MAVKKDDRRLPTKIEKMLLVLQFLVAFNLLAIPMYVVIWTNAELYSLKVLEARLCSLILNAVGIQNFSRENSLYFFRGGNLYVISVSWDSTGWKSLYTFFSLVLATPIAWRKKMLPLIIGLPVIFIANIARIVSTIAFSFLSSLQYFSFLHNFLWKEGMIFLVVLLWGFWLWKEKDNINENKYIFRWFFGRRRRKAKSIRARKEASRS